MSVCASAMLVLVLVLRNRRRSLEVSLLKYAKHWLLYALDIHNVPLSTNGSQTRWGR